MTKISVIDGSSGSLGVLDVFVRVSETRSFTAAAQQLGISSSAVSKAIGRLEERLRVRLLHRSTRAVSLTPEGVQFLERCRRILCEVEAAENELSQSQTTPFGRLRVSVPSMGMLFMAKFAAFKQSYPDIDLDIDCTDRLVDVIEDGFDAVIRSGAPTDSRLVARELGTYRHVIVGAPTYFQRAGIPQQPQDLQHHTCIHYRYPNTGKLAIWPLGCGQPFNLELPSSMVTNTLDPQVTFAEHGVGIACIPDMAVRRQLAANTLITVLDDFNQNTTALHILWPSSRYSSPKLRIFIDYMVSHLFPF